MKCRKGEVCSAYITVASETLHVVAAYLPIELMTNERVRKYNKNNKRKYYSKVTGLIKLERRFGQHVYYPTKERGFITSNIDRTRLFCGIFKRFQILENNICWYCLQTDKLSIQCSYAKGETTKEELRRT